jgi:TonB family protein
MPTTLKTCCQSFLLLLLLSGSAWAQSSDSNRAAQQALNALRHREIPEATLPCTTEEREWWNKLRAAGEAVRKNMGDESDTRKFHKLFAQGIKESYQPPIENRGPTILYQVPFRPTEESRKKKISGALALTVELRADGTVGEIKIVQGLGHGLDESATEAARRIVFLPTVKDRKFVTVYSPMTMSLSGIRQTYPWR